MLGSARGVLMKKGNPDALPATAMALYNFNAGTGLTAADLSGNSRTMTLNSAVWDAGGHTSNAITNTTSGEGAKVSFTAPTVAITMMAWVKPLDLTAGTTRPVIGFIDNGNSTGCAIFAQRSDFGTSNVLQGNIRIGATLYQLPGAVMTLNTWAHVALTYDGTTANLYKDGAFVTSVTASGNIGQGDHFYAAGWTPGSYFAHVTVDDVRVYNVALTAGQVATGMNSPVV